MILKVCVCNILLNYASRCVLENLSKLVRKSSQNTSKIDLEGGLEAAREPPLCGGDPKTSFSAILAPLWDPIWGPVLVHVWHIFVYVFDMSPRWHCWRFGIHVCPIVDAFLGTFSEARLNLHVKHDMHENISI